MKWPLYLLCTLVGTRAETVERNVTYTGAGCTSCPSCTCMDLFLPTKADATRSPFVLLFHGGLWYSGARGEMEETCQSVLRLSKGTIGCATADYRYSQDLGGSCPSAPSSSSPTYQKQAAEVVAAFKYLANRQEVDSSKILLGGHSAGGHLSAWLAFNWLPGKAGPYPAAFMGVEGIYNVTLWDEYDQTRWRGEFHCATRQAFGEDVLAWKEGSPIYSAVGGQPPVSPMLLIHSPGDDFVQNTQATTFFEDLPPAQGGQSSHVLDVAGRCVSGEHPDVLKGSSAATLASCAMDFLRAQLATTLVM